jgi:hypothetical protein
MALIAFETPIPTEMASFDEAKKNISQIKETREQPEEEEEEEEQAPLDGDTGRNDEPHNMAELTNSTEMASRDKAKEGISQIKGTREPPEEEEEPLFYGDTGHYNELRNMVLTGLEASSRIMRASCTTVNGRVQRLEREVLAQVDKTRKQTEEDKEAHMCDKNHQLVHHDGVIIDESKHQAADTEIQQSTSEPRHIAGQHDDKVATSNETTSQEDNQQSNTIEKQQSCNNLSIGAIQSKLIVWQDLLEKQKIWWSQAFERLLNNSHIETKLKEHDDESHGQRLDRDDYGIHEEYVEVDYRDNFYFPGENDTREVEARDDEEVSGNKVHLQVIHEGNNAIEIKSMGSQPDDGCSGLSLLGRIQGLGEWFIPLRNKEEHTNAYINELTCFSQSRSFKKITSPKFSRTQRVPATLSTRTTDSKDGGIRSISSNYDIILSTRTTDDSMDGGIRSSSSSYDGIVESKNMTKDIGQLPSKDMDLFNPPEMKVSTTQSAPVLLSATEADEFQDSNSSSSFSSYGSSFNSYGSNDSTDTCGALPMKFCR